MGGLVLASKVHLPPLGQKQQREPGGGGGSTVSAPRRLCLQGGGDLAAGEVPRDIGGIHSLALGLRNVPGLGEGLPKKAGSCWWSHIAVTMGRVPEGSARARQRHRDGVSC